MVTNELGLTVSMVTWLHASELTVRQRAMVGVCGGAQKLPWGTRSRENRKEPGTCFLQ